MPTTTALTPRQAIILTAYHHLAQCMGAVPVDGYAWGTVVFLADLAYAVRDEVNGEADTLAVVLDLAARTEGMYSSVVTDEYGETRIVFDAGILG